MLRVCSRWLHTPPFGAPALVEAVPLRGGQSSTPAPVEVMNGTVVRPLLTNCRLAIQRTH
jgi:hypothetical protein